MQPLGREGFLDAEISPWILAGLGAPAGACLSSHLVRELLLWLAGEHTVPGVYSCVSALSGAVPWLTGAALP